MSPLLKSIVHGVTFTLALCIALPPRPCAGGDQPEFSIWLDELRAEAAASGISQGTLDTALADLATIPRVIELDRKQPEFTLTLEEYLIRVVPEARVRKGRHKLEENRDLLLRIGKEYGVQANFLVAFWGVETDFGRITGGFPVISALATLAFDGRRSDYFRRELLDALQIVDDGHITADGMMGSWAGAMGQPQFMPSSFRRYAVDHDGDGRADIWNTREDVFASAASYLSQSGWIYGQKWGRAVGLPDGFERSALGLDHRKRLSDWQALGVRRADGRDLPNRPDLLSSIVQPDGPGTSAFVVYDNYRAILRWNRSHLFGIAIGTLADRIGAP